MTLDIWMALVCGRKCWGLLGRMNLAETGKSCEEREMLLEQLADWHEVEFFLQTWCSPFIKNNNLPSNIRNTEWRRDGSPSWNLHVEKKTWCFWHHSSAVGCLLHFNVISLKNTESEILRAAKVRVIAYDVTEPKRRCTEKGYVAKATHRRKSLCSHTWGWGLD